MLPHFQSRFGVAEFQRRREALSDAIDGHTAILRGLPASGAMDPFRQGNAFYYLCGVAVPHAYLRIRRAGASTLYLPPSDPRLAAAEGPELNADDPEVAQRLTGVDEVRPLTALASDLRTESVLYTPRDAPEGRRACQDSLADARRLADRDPWAPVPGACSLASVLRRRLDPIELHDLSPSLNQLRRFKSDAEMSVLRTAGRITAVAICEAIRSTKPGLIEHQLAAVAEYVFALNGAAGGAYQPIVASGTNTWNVHYARNNCRLDSGELVLMDYAPDFHYYTSDIGRIWPVDGEYLPSQREPFALVVDYHRALLDLIEPGITPHQLRVAVAERMRPLASRTRWSSGPLKDAVEKLLGTSRSCTHDVGMAIHDSSGYQPDDEPLLPGVVFALDPQFWIPQSQTYLRVEDCVAINADGVENLTSEAPIDLDEIEQLMTEDGLLQRDTHLLVDPS